MFRWIKPGSDSAAAAMVVARVCCKGMRIEQAIEDTLELGGHCNNPNMMSDDQRNRFRMLVEEKLNNSIKRRQEYERNEITSPSFGIFQGREKLHA
jgi:hypothetical protein